jgi:hypothetical protein
MIRVCLVAGTALLIGACVPEGAVAPQTGGGDPDAPTRPLARRPEGSPEEMITVRRQRQPPAPGEYALAFSRLGSQIMLASADGSRIGGPLDEGSNPDWSSRGTLVYECGEKLCTFEPDRGYGRVVIKGPGGTYWGPDWSPDGTELAYVEYDCTVPDPYYGTRCEGGVLAVSGANGEGGFVVPLPSQVLWMYHPDWSPDGKRIAFSCMLYQPQHGTYSYDICDVARDGSDFRQLTSSAAHETYPAWSPDGSRIAYQLGRVADIEHPYEIVVIPAQGGEPRRVREGLYGQYPSWSPDGRKIAFTGYFDPSWGMGGVQVMSADGGGPLETITTNSGDYAPVWRPW